MHRSVPALALAATCLIAQSPALAARIKPVSAREAQAIFACIRDEFFEQKRINTVFRLKLAADASTRTFAENLIHAREWRKDLQPSEKPLRCARTVARSAPVLKGELTHDPEHLLDHTDTYRTTECEVRWPIRRGRQLSVSINCMGGLHEPLQIRDGAPCGGNRTFGSGLYATYFRRTVNGWEKTGTAEIGIGDFSSSRPRCTDTPVK